MDNGMRGKAVFRLLNSVKLITSSTEVPRKDPPPPQTHNTGDWLMLFDDDQLLLFLLLEVTGDAQDLLQSATHSLRQRTSKATRDKKYRTTRETPGAL